MARKSKRNKPRTFWVGRTVFVIVSIATGAAGVLGWLQSDGNIFANAALAFLAGASAAVLPICAGQFGRGWATLGMIPAVLVFGGVNAYSVHNAVGVLIEAPRIAAHDAEIVPLNLRVTTAQAALDKAKAAKLAIVRTGPCEGKHTCERQEARFKADHALADAAIAAAETDLSAAGNKLDLSAAGYKPFVADWLVWTLGLLLDVAIALGIWVLETSARKEARQERERREAERRIREEQQRRQEKAKTRPPKQRHAVPSLGDDLSPRERAVLWGAPRLAAQDGERLN